MGHYIPASHLPNLRLYKYHGIDRSLLSHYVLQPYWNWLVTLFPLWMAPNLITLLGFLCIVVNVATLLYLDPEMKGYPSQWLYWSWALGLWTYQSFDAIDGKQARRTGSSGPLGELFDHGCDALNTTLCAMLVAEAIGVRGWLAVLALFGSYANFYITTWDEYHTGSLYLSYISGPVEGLVLIVFVFIATGFLGGPAFWSLGYKSVFPNLFPFLPDVPINVILLAFSQLVVLLNVISSFRNVYALVRSKNERFRNSLLRLLPYFPIPVIASAWFYLSPGALEHRFAFIVLYLGLAFSFTVGRMIVAYVSKYRYPRTNVILVPAGLWVANLLLARITGFVLVSIEHEMTWIYGCLFYALAVYGHFAYDVIGDICSFFDIYCLSLKHPPSSKSQKEQ